MKFIDTETYSAFRLLQGNRVPESEFSFEDPFQHQFYFQQEEYLNSNFWIFKQTIDIKEAEELASEAAGFKIPVRSSWWTEAWNMHYVPALNVIFVPMFPEQTNKFFILHEAAHAVSRQGHTMHMAEVLVGFVCKYIGCVFAEDLDKFLSKAFTENTGDKHVSLRTVRAYVDKNRATAKKLYSFPDFDESGTHGMYTYESGIAYRQALAESLHTNNYKYNIYPMHTEWDRGGSSS